uniref:Uncharacterized protein n=1 Tax=Anguilla anguilla TaxID=7936 RepID=A0A0E9QND8_ANGAN
MHLEFSTHLLLFQFNEMVPYRCERPKRKQRFFKCRDEIYYIKKI